MPGTSSLQLILEALADQIREAVNDDPEFPVQVEPKPILSATPPTIDIYPAPIPRESDTAGFGDLDGAYLITVRARVDINDREAGWDLLVGLLDDMNALSVTSAVETEPSLGGVAAQAIVIERTGPEGFVNGDGNQLLGCTWTVLAIPAAS